jgi:thioredoxin 1
MIQKKKNTKEKSMIEKTRPLQIAVLVIVIAIGSVMVFNNRTTSTEPPRVQAQKSGEESNVMILTDAVFDQTISQGVTLVDFWATWCPPCRIQNPIIEQVAGEIGANARIAKLDVDHNPQSARAHQVQNIPTLIIFKDGKPVQRFVGVQQKETLMAAIESHL